MRPSNRSRIPESSKRSRNEAIEGDADDRFSFEGLNLRDNEGDEVDSGSGVRG